MEEKTEKSSEDRTESSTLIPLDLIRDILLRLPAKSIVRFRCVSKLWSSMTTTPDFVRSFHIHSAARPFLLSVKKEEDKRVFYSLPYHHDHPQTRVEKYQMMLPTEDTCIFMNSFNIPQSINGLISFRNSESVIIWNPTLRQHVTLPQPKVSKPLISLLGYDPIGDEYKVLCMSLCEDAKKNGEKLQIFTMGAQESWRTIQNCPGPMHCTMRICKYIKGVVYYFAGYGTIVSFDMRSEKFEAFQRPEMLQPNESGFLSQGGRLVWFSNYFSLGAEKTLLWFLEDAEKHEWSQEVSILPFERINSLGFFRLYFLILSGETADDELVFLPTMSTYEPFYAIYFDIKSGLFKKGFIRRNRLCQQFQF